LPALAVALCSIVLLLDLPHTARAADDALPMISTSGSHFVDARGSQVVLKGCNLGNYLMLESWMFGGTLGAGPDHAFRDGATVYRTLRQRFGEEKLRHLVELYRNGWVMPRDFSLIKSFGFNVVRLPFDYRLIQEEQPPFAIKRDAFAWLDHAVQMAQDAGLYVILDLHGTPGGQSLEDHTGEAGQDHLWTNPEDQKRTADVWRALAEHFKDRSSVAAYDLVNEPYGNHHEDCRPILARLMPEIYRAIRSTGDQHVVFFSGALNGGIVFYGNPHNSGMTNVAFTEHFYPGLFGSTPALETQARVLNQELPAKHDYADEIASPYYVGEFNVVLESEDPARMMRAYYDRFAEYGWACTMWSYKILSAKGGVGASPWYMVTNAGPLPTVDLDNSSYEDIANFFTSLATTPLAVNKPLYDAVTTPTPAPLYVAGYPRLPAAPPTNPPPSEPDGYTSVDLGGATPGYTAALADGSVLVMGGGQDVFGASDSCRFVSHPAHGGSADARATILSFVDSGEYAKAGVMARWGQNDHPDAAMAMVNLFPDGTIALISRQHPGTAAIEQKIGAGVQLPVELRLQISAGRATGMYRNNSGDWRTIGSAPVPNDPDFRVGLAVCAHIDAVLTTVKARLDRTADNDLPAPGQEGGNVPSGPSLLANGSFQQQGDQSDLAAHWDRWGSWMNREITGTPTHSGSSEIGYHHGRITSDATSGLWQDVQVQPGRRYVFSIYAQHDQVDAGAHDAKTLELRTESVTPNGQVTLNSRNFDIATLPTGQAWARLAIPSTAAGERMRVLAIITPAEIGPRGGAVKLDDASLVLAPGQAGGASADPAPTDVAEHDPPDETAIPAEANPYRDLVYASRGGRNMKLDLFTPPAGGPFPLVIWIHGGAWKMGDKAQYMHMMFLLRRGFAVANIEYRFSQVAPFPAQLDDCESALDFLTANAATYHLDPNRIAATGESAGGHLASLLGMSRSARRTTAQTDAARGRIRAVIDLAGPSDLAELNRDSTDADLHRALEQLVGGPLDQQAELVRAADPIAQVSQDDPPFLILHGTADPLVPFSQSQRLADALKKAGADVELIPIPNAGHVGPAFWITAQREKIIAFLQRSMNLQ